MTAPEQLLALDALDEMVAGAKSRPLSANVRIERAVLEAAITRLELALPLGSPPVAESLRELRALAGTGRGTASVNREALYLTLDRIRAIMPRS